MKRVSLLMLLLCPLLISACGPEQTSRNKEEDQIAANVEDQRKLYGPLAGKYVGTLTYVSGRTVNVALYLISVMKSIDNSGRNESSSVPTLAGSLNVCLASIDQCFGADNTTSATDSTFSQAYFDRASKRLTLFTPGATNSSTPTSTTTSGGTVGASQIQGTINGDVYTAKYYTNVNELSGDLVLRKAN